MLLLTVVADVDAAAAVVVVVVAAAAVAVADQLEWLNSDCWLAWLFAVSPYLLLDNHD